MKKPITTLGSILAIVLIALLIGVGWFLWKNSTKPTDNTPVTDNRPYDANEYYDEGPGLETQKLWGQDQTALGLHEPSVSELDKIYKNVRTAKTNRDLDLFRNNATGKMYFLFLNTFQYKGVNKDSIPVIARVEPSGPEYFKAYAALRNSFAYPTDLSQLSPISSSPFKYSPDPVTIVDDQIEHTDYKLEDPAFDNYYVLYYKIKDLAKNNLTKNSNDDHDGAVYFAWDNGKWRYNTEDWRIMPVAGTASGEIDARATKTVTITGVKNDDLGTYDYSPASITIKAGEKIKWVNATGIIASTENSKGTSPWNSARLLEQSFEKVFTQKGTYKYSILNWEQEFHGEITVN